ncbi:hypothetical protein K438DRAFT_1869687 [Mycena galopus ATCC 62051]|nr:hypothetical protein K438DRAFT_1869687 [Mycena galopus ATCC 62051]
MPLRPDLAYPEGTGYSSQSWEFNTLLRNQGLPIITDADLEGIFVAAGVPPAQRAAEAKKFMDRANAIGLSPIGRKPEANLDDNDMIMIVPFPDEPLAIRFFTGGTDASSRMWFFDFYDIANRCPVNAPAGYAVTIVSPLALSGPVPSMESTLLVEEKLKPGAERFTVMERVSCSLARPGRAQFLFEVPSRTANANVAHAIPFRMR